MKMQATGWQAVRYGEATFSVYNYVLTADKQHILSSTANDHPVASERTTELRSTSVAPAEAISVVP